MATQGCLDLFSMLNFGENSPRNTVTDALGPLFTTIFEHSGR